MTHKGWIASTYELPDRLFAVIFNTTTEDTRGTVHMITRGMNLSPTVRPVIYDPVGDQETTGESLDQIPLALPARSGKLITITK